MPLIVRELAQHTQLHILISAGLVLQEEMAKFRDLEYCKIDLIASKGIVFCKYAKISSALLALEAIMANDNVVRTV